MLSLLSAFSVIAAHLASQELLFGQWVRDRVLMRSAAKAGMERVLYDIQSDKFLTFESFNEAWASNEKYFHNHVLGDVAFSLECPVDEDILYGACDEAARIN